MKIRERIFDALTELTSRFPWLVLLGALLLTVAGAGLAGGLKMETRVLDVLPKDDPAALEFEEIVKQYSSASQIMVGIEADTRQQMIAFAEALGRRAHQAEFTEKATGEQRPYVKRVTVRADVDFIEQHGLMLAKQKDLQDLDEIFQDLSLGPLLAAYNDFLEREYVEDSSSVTEREKEDRAIDSLKSLVLWLEGIALDGEQALAERAERVAQQLSTGETYMFSEDDQMLLVLIVPAISMDRLDEMIDGVASLQRIVDRLEQEHPGVTARMTGMPVISYQEMEVGFEDMELSSLISFVLVLALFVISFRMWTAPLLAMITLVIGIVWTSGFIAISVGRLNLFTLMFAIILIGLGIDFSIHMNAAYSTARSEGRSLRDGLREMYRRAGPGVITGALTTAAAFFAMMFSGLDALMELGLVLGSGIVLTMLASLIVLPAMYAAHDRVAERLARGKPRRPKRVLLAFPVLAALGRGIGRRPWIAVVVMVVITGAMVWIGRGAEFEPDMMEIEPPDMSSVVLHRQIIDRFELHPDHAMVTSDDFDKTREWVRKLKKNRLVGRVDAITEFLPSAAQHKKRKRLAAAIGERMAELAEPRLMVGLPGGTAVVEPHAYETAEVAPKAQVDLLLTELDRLQMNVQEIGQLAFTSMKNRLSRTCDRLAGGDNPSKSRILALKQRLAADPALGRRIADYEREYVPRLAGRLARMADTSPITLASLPESIRERYLSADGRNLVTIYSSVDLWQEGKTELFLKATQKASDRVTGTAVLVDRMVELIGARGKQASLLALAAVFLLLLLDFRHLGYALLGMLPLVSGFAWMVGLFVLSGWKFDVANVMALPLILGIGIDDAVHVLHAVRRLGAAALPDVLRHTGRALVLTSLTTAIAFGSIAFANHRGMAGMGLLLVLGVASCLITSLVLLPALLRIFYGKDRSKKQTVKEVGDAS